MRGKALSAVKSGCEMGEMVPAITVESGCAAMSLLLVAIPGAVISIPAFVVACQGAFIAVAISCEVIKSQPGSNAFCGLIRDFVEVFDPDGVRLSVYARKDGARAGKDVDVPSGVPLVNVDVEIRTPKLLRTTLQTTATTTRDRIVQECGAGLISIRRDEDRLAFSAPKLIRGGVVDSATLDEVADVLRIERSEIVDARWADNGPGWVAVLLASADAVLAVEPERSYPKRMDIGVVGLYPPGGEIAYEIRAIFSDHRRTLMEDPVTGSLNASVAQWLLSSGRVKAPYVVAQGTRVGRSGRIYISQDTDGEVWVGGKATTLFSGICTV